MSRISLRSLLALLAGVCLLYLGIAAPVASAPVGWQPLGPDGGPVHQLALNDPLHPQTIYAAAGEGGLYRSLDGGEHWLPFDIRVGDAPVRAVGVLPHDSTTIFVGLEDAGVRMSMDSGVTWHCTELDDVTVRGFIFDPQNPLVVYALTEWSLYRSVNRGWNWDPVSGVYSVRTLALRPHNSQILYAGSNGGVYKSWDGGCNWRRIGLPGEEIWSVAIDPQSPDTVYAGTWNGGLFRSEDGGVNWKSISLPAQSHVHTIIIGSETPHPTLTVASDDKLLRSEDGGASWRSFGDALHPRRIQSFLPVSNAIFLVATDTGIFKSEDDGETWRATNQGIINTRASSLAVYSANSRQILVAVQSYQGSREILKSADGGFSWQPIYQTTGYTFSVALTFHPSNPDIIFIGSGCGVVKSTDGGLTWRTLTGGLPSSTITTLQVDPANSDVVYAGTLDQGVFKSDDGGETWHQTGLERQWVKDLALAPGNSQIIYAGISCSCSNGVCHSLYRSDDGGETWHETTHFGYTRVSANSVAVSPLSPDIIYAGTLRYGLFKSDDGGETWRHLDLDERAIQNIIIHPRFPQWLFASGPNHGLSMSQDSGESWKSFNPGLPGAYISDLKIALASQDASFTYALYVATDGRGVLVYRDAALIWLPLIFPKP